MASSDGQNMISQGFQYAMENMKSELPKKISPAVIFPETLRLMATHPPSEVFNSKNPFPSSPPASVREFFALDLDAELVKDFKYASQSALPSPKIPHLGLLPLPKIGLLPAKSEGPCAAGNISACFGLIAIFVGILLYKYQRP